MQQRMGCGEDFGSLTSFDFHRVGKHGKDRRCLTVDELIILGMRIDNNGRWRMPGGYHIGARGDFIDADE